MQAPALYCDPKSLHLRCLIVDDNERFLAAARSTLDRDGVEVVGTATTAPAAMREAKERKPDVVLLDISLGSDSGFDVAWQLVRSFPELRLGIVLISTRSEQDYADLIKASPAIGFLAKSQLSAAAIRELVSRADGN